MCIEKDRWLLFICGPHFYSHPMYCVKVSLIPLLAVQSIQHPTKKIYMYFNISFVFVSVRFSIMKIWRLCPKVSLSFSDAVNVRIDVVFVTHHIYDATEVNDSIAVTQALRSC